MDPADIASIIGVVKAYTTRYVIAPSRILVLDLKTDFGDRVGSGPFPSELIDELGEKLQTVGKEFGVTTGRRRRCGWLDLNVVKYSVDVNSYTEINLTKLDILDDFPEIKVAISYRNPVTKEKIEGFPADLNLLEKVEVEYATLKGWVEPIGHCRSFSELPPAVSDDLVLGICIFL